MAGTEKTLETIAATLRDERRERGLSQEAFAELLGVSRPYLSELESGKGTIQLRRLIRALNAVGVDLVPVKRK